MSSRIRRRVYPTAMSGGVFTPKSITGLAIWLDFSDATTLFTDSDRTTAVTADGNVIGGVTDKSGNAIHATQAGAAGVKPLYKVNIKNGLSAGLFDNSDDVLTHAYPLGAATDFTLFMVVNHINPEAYNSVLSTSVAGAWGVYSMHTDATNAMYIGTDITNRIVTAGAYVTDNTYYIHTFKKSGTSAGNLSLYKNNGTATVNTGKTGANPSSNVVILGDSAAAQMVGANAYICEYLVYNSALSDADRSRVVTYLNTKWAVF